MKIAIVVLLQMLMGALFSPAWAQAESEELLCARSISSMAAILGQLKNNPSIRNEQISAAIDGHTQDPALRRFIRSDIAPKVMSQDKPLSDAYLNSSALISRCVDALRTYNVSGGE